MKKVIVNGITAVNGPGSGFVKKNENKMKMKKYRAEYGNMYRTRYYATRAEAQDALMRRCGHFHYLGSVAGDGFSPNESYCSSAPRNGGLVVIIER